MPGRRSSAGGRPIRSQSVSQISWRRASAIEAVNLAGVEITGGVNGFIDPEKAIGKLKRHGLGLWGMQAVVAFMMLVIAVIAGGF